MSIEKIRKMVLAGLNGRDPFHDPHSWDLCEKKLPKSTWNYLTDRTGAAKFSARLPKIFSANLFIQDMEAQVCWERIGNFYRNQGRLHEALSIYHLLYRISWQMEMLSPSGSLSFW